MSSNIGILPKFAFNSKFINNALAYWFLINLNFLQPHVTDVNKSIIFLLFVFVTLGVLLSIFFGNSNNTIILLYKRSKIFDELFKFLIVSFLSSYSFNALFTEKNL